MAKRGYTASKDKDGVKVAYSYKRYIWLKSSIQIAMINMWLKGSIQLARINMAKN